MSLPIILNAPKYEVELPISKKTVTYRPYLVKEEKLLMMALESKDQKHILKTIQDVIGACTFGDLNIKTLPTSELELLFLKLRAKSVGETSTVSYECGECKTPNDVTINLNDVEIKFGEKVDPKIMLTDSVGITLKYPNSEDISKTMSSESSDIKTTFNIITACVESIFDTENVYQAKDMQKKDIEEFIDSLNSQQFGKIQEFFVSIPKLSHAVSFKCEKCGSDNDITVEGLQHFFA
jgi:DNA-directed RNA polymerase subunit RPC12/RpoP